MARKTKPTVEDPLALPPAGRSTSRTRRAKPVSTDAAPSRPASSAWWVQLRAALWRYREELAGLALGLWGGLTLLALLRLTEGRLISAWAGLLQQIFGYGSYVAALAFVAGGLALLTLALRGTVTIAWLRLLGAEIVFFASLGLLHILSGDPNPLGLAAAGGGGGYVGWALSTLLRDSVGSFLAGVILFLVLALGAGLASALRLADVRAGLQRLIETLELLARPLEEAAVSNGNVPVQPANQIEIESPSGPARSPRLLLPRPSAPLRRPGLGLRAQPNSTKPSNDGQALTPPAMDPSSVSNGSAAPGPGSPRSRRSSPAIAPSKPPSTPANDSLSSSPVVDRTSAAQPESKIERPVRPASSTKSSERKGKAPKSIERPVPLEVLDPSVPLSLSPEEADRKARTITETLQYFGVPVEQGPILQGPAVTMFGVIPGYVRKTLPDGQLFDQKVRVNQISALANDLAMALAAPRIRIQAPVPGQPYVGIEVPNITTSVVNLRTVMEADRFERLRAKSPLAITMGMDVAGQPVAADLASMPHLLIAGTTGSGKSVCISALTTCLAINNTPEDLRLVMVDPKMVELIRFNGLPHLFGKVEVELERIIAVLHWATREMDRRYQVFAEVGARNMADYRKIAARESNVEPLPYIVIIIDELADLMMMAPDDTERTLCRLAQMARATGIHLVVATQRPSTDVVTGLIKANFPARIAFAVASSMDSRVILDSVGAETLLGRGDMLFLAPDAPGPKRIQGCFVTDAEMTRVVEYWQKEYGERPVSDAPWEHLVHELANGGASDDELLARAIALVQQTHSASASLLQRRLRIGFPRAARLMDELEAKGIIAPADGGGRTREVYRDKPESDEEF